MAPHLLFKAQAIAVAAGTVIVVLCMPRPAHSLGFGLGGGIISAIAYAKCVDAGRSLCELLLLDPPGEDVTGINLTVSYDASKVEIDPTPLFFCDFSESGSCPSLVTPLFGSSQPLTPDPGIDLSVATPRAGTAVTFTNDETAGLLTLNYDLAANPAPGAGDRYFFGFGLYRQPSFANFDLVQYFNTPGDYDITFTGFSCTTLDGTDSCGSSTPVFGVNLVPIPEPSALLLMGSGFVALRFRRWRQNRAGKHSLAN